MSRIFELLNKSSGEVVDLVRPILEQQTRQTPRPDGESQAREVPSAASVAPVSKEAPPAETPSLASIPNGSEQLSRPEAALSDEPTGIPIDGTCNSVQKLIARPAAQTTREFGGLSERRRTSRSHIPTLRVYYWTGGPPTPHQVVDISENGAYFETRDRWPPGSIIEMTLQRVRETDGNPLDPRTSLHVVSKVVRTDSGGLGVQFIYTQRREHLRTREFLALLTSA